MNRTELIARLRALDACEEGIAWIEQTPGEPADLWAACPRGDWLIWLLAKVAYDKRVIRHIACDCAEGVLPIYERHRPDDRRPRDAIAVARRYADGEATEEEMVAAGAAAELAAGDAAELAAGDAACAAARAATAAEDATEDAAWVAAADAAWDAAGAAAWDAAEDAAKDAAEDAARAAARARQADMVRARVSWADVERAMLAQKGDKE